MGRDEHVGGFNEGVDWLVSLRPENLLWDKTCKTFYGEVWVFGSKISQMTQMTTWRSNRLEVCEGRCLCSKDLCASHQAARNPKVTEEGAGKETPQQQGGSGVSHVTLSDARVEWLQVMTDMMWFSLFFFLSYVIYGYLWSVHSLNTCFMYGLMPLVGKMMVPLVS